MTPMLTFDSVSKRYGNRLALSNVSFSAEKGEIIALLGRNGAGKSTLMNILTGYISMTEGRVQAGGHDVQLDPMAARKLIGYLPEQPPLYPDMTVTEYLRYCAELKGIARKNQRSAMDDVIQRTGLNEYARRLSGRLSKGYRQRLGVAQALLGSPALLVLDEPGSGLDPLQMLQMRDVIRATGETSTVLLSSHILSEVTNVCSRALVLDRGVLRYDGDMRTLLQGEGCLTAVWQGGNEIEPRLRALPGVRSVTCTAEADGFRAAILHDPACDLRAAVSQTIQACGGTLLELTPRQEALETAFLRLLDEKEVAP